MSQPFSQPNPVPGSGRATSDRAPATESYAPAPGSEFPYRYDARLADHVERAWQERWDHWHADGRSLFRVMNPGEPGFDGSRPKYYVLDMFPYPSGAGLHVGHPEGYTATDILSRYKRMCGFNVLHPMGWDAFGLPAEQYAIQTGIHPAETTRKSIETFRRQLKRFGFCYDWSREFGTIDEGYYHWTQWIFLRIYQAWFDPRQNRARHVDELVKEAEAGRVATPRPWAQLTRAERDAFVDEHRLAYLKEQVVNWCPKLGTVLANDEVIDGKSERGGYPVLRKPLKQWVFRITAYADRLLRQIDALEWTESTKTMQRDWIGRSEGAEVDFEIRDGETERRSGGVKEEGAASAAERRATQRIRVFTTRPDTIFGATYMVVAPEHELCSAVVAGRWGVDDATRMALEKYVAWARNRSDVERQENKEKTGVFTGVHAINPATGEPIPVWAADYVLTGYGTGAIMAVPAHDERDYEFAEQFGLPIRDVVYTRQELAMRYYVMHATDAEKAGERWSDVLSDFLGLVTSASTPPEKFLEALTTVRVRRRPLAPDAPSQPVSDTPGSVGHRRGVTKSVWLDFLESMHLAGFAELERIFTEAGYARHQGSAVDEPGFAVNSANPEVSLDGLHTQPAIDAIIAWFERTGRGARRINYKLRDWVFSRQRYWGEPFPIVYDAEGRAYPVMESALPVKLPVLADYAPVESQDPQPLLAKVKDWVKTTAGDAGVDPALLAPQTPVTRETNTMPGSAGSSWYAIRYCDPRNGERFVGREAERYWMGPGEGAPAANTGVPIGGVDFYLGGSEHAVGHLLYARFWQNVLYDLGEVSTAEPFRRLYHQGLITSFAYQRKDKTLVPSDQVKEVGEKEYAIAATGEPVTQIIAKMSKSLKNVVNPDDVIGEYGADTFRLYEMYMGPLDQSKPWNPRDIAGCFRFLQRVWRNFVDEQTGKSRILEEGTPLTPEATEALRATNRTIKGVRRDIEELGFNTAISKLIELNNLLAKLPAVPLEIARPFILMLAPLAPHLAEELWACVFGANGTSVADRAFPEPDESLLAADSVEIAVQVAGKVRARIRVPVGAASEAVEAAAMADPGVQSYLAGKSVSKVIVVPGRMVNIVAK